MCRGRPDSGCARMTSARRSNGFELIARVTLGAESTGSLSDSPHCTGRAPNTCRSISVFRESGAQEGSGQAVRGLETCTHIIDRFPSPKTWCAGCTASHSEPQPRFLKRSILATDRRSQSPLGIGSSPLDTLEHTQCPLTSPKGSSQFRVVI